jgi:hypothetical protein
LEYHPKREISYPISDELSGVARAMFFRIAPLTKKQEDDDEAPIVRYLNATTLILHNGDAISEERSRSIISL